MAQHFAEFLTHRLSRRSFMLSSAAAATLFATSGLSKTEVKTPSLAMRVAEEVELLPGYRYQRVISWGDAVLNGLAPEFAVEKITAEAQEKRFGFHCDYIAYFPLNGSERGLLCVNHEYADARHMFAGYQKGQPKTKAQVEVELAAHGHSVLEVARDKKGNWARVEGSRYHRRISARSTFSKLTGPAAGSDRLKTNADPSGTKVLGTLGNCAGGKTPWGTVLIAEENFDEYFEGALADTQEARNYKRYGVSSSKGQGWAVHAPRFDIAVTPNEPNRFGWVVELDPEHPQSQPVKHTALGRFKHESATVALAPDGRVVVYSGDDEANEYLYRFVSKGKYVPERGKENSALLTEGVLSVAQFSEDGLRWLPLVYGEGPLTPANGFNTQADVLIEARIAAELRGATPMDRPEDIEVHPNGAVFLALTNNRTRITTDSANPRRLNIHGHIIALKPPLANGKPDHAAETFGWDIVLKGGNPENPLEGAHYPRPNEKTWLSCPDNLAIDPSGRLWIASDGQPKTIHNSDSLYCLEKDGGLKRVMNAPKGAEVTGPEFTPDGRTLFVSIQHPDRWPNRQGPLPAASSVIALSREDGAPL